MSTRTPILDLGSNPSALPFEIHTMRWLSENRWKQNEHAHRHNYHVIIWVIHAKGFHFVDLEKHELTDNTIYCVAPGQVHQMVTAGPVEGYVISFNESFLGPSDNQAGLVFRSPGSVAAPSVIPVDKDMTAALADVVANMQREFDNFFLLRGEVLRGFLKIFLVYISRQYDHSGQVQPITRNAELVRSFTELLEQKFRAEHKVAAYAAELVVTPSYLNEVVKKKTGFPASHHIQQRIILEAKRQAMYGGMSMKEISYDLGFEDQAHFSKFFKNATGANFTEFKKNLSDGFIQ